MIREYTAIVTIRVKLNVNAISKAKAVAAAHILASGVLRTFDRSEVDYIDVQSCSPLKVKK